MKSKTQGSEVTVKANAADRRYAGTKIKYTNEPLGDVKVIPDFLPSIAELAFNEECVKIALALSKKVWIFLSRKPRKITPNISA